MKIFVSYSRRDGVVTSDALRLLERHLSSFATPFIHCLQPERRWEQLSVLVSLVGSHMVLLIDSPAARASPWVRLELIIARALLRPILRLEVTDLVFRSET